MTGFLSFWILLSRVTKGRSRAKAVAAIIRSGISGTVSRSILFRFEVIKKSMGTSSSPVCIS